MSNFYSYRLIRGNIVIGGIFAWVLMVSSIAMAQLKIETPAREAFMIDSETGTVLLNKNGAVSMPPASMSKMMTLYMLFEQIEDGRITLEDRFLVSRTAWKKGGSKMFVNVGNQVKVEDLIRGIVIQSGNDAAIVVAEALAGTESAFATLMNEKAAELGMTGSQFSNATGWPDPNHFMTARDLAYLSMLLIKRFPVLYRYFSEKSFTYNKIRQGNRNPLLYKNIGADGLKTGHTKEAGYGLTASMVRRGRRLVLVINGMKSSASRAREAVRLFNWAFREYNNHTLFDMNEKIVQADVWLGNRATVPLVHLVRPVTVTIPRISYRKMRVTALYEAPIPVPFSEGKKVGVLRVEAPRTKPVEFDLVTGAKAEALSPFERIWSAAAYMFIKGGIAR